MTATLTPNLMTDDVNASVAFYGENLGFKFQLGVPFDSETPVDESLAGTPLQWAMMDLDGAKLMFQARASLAQEYPPMQEVEISPGGTLYLEVEALDPLLRRLHDRVEIVLPDHVTFYGMREAWIRDNNGYLLALAEKTQAC